MATPEPHEPTPVILDYAAPRPRRPDWKSAPAWVAPASLVPLALFLAWFRWVAELDRWLGLHLGERWERLTGFLWISAVVLTFACIVYYWRRPKPWYVRCCIGLHGLFIAATILPPGCIMLAWLMHWLSGPGA